MSKKENVFKLPKDPGPSPRDIELSGGNINAFDHFRLLLEQATGRSFEFSSNFSGNENIQYLEGKEAQAMAQVVYSRWRGERKQLLSKVKRRTKQPNKVLTRYLPISGPKVHRAMHFHFLFRSVLSIKNDRFKKNKPDSGPEFIVVPANIEKDMYFFEEEYGSFACFSDQHGFPVLTAQTYHALQQQGITSATDIALILSEIYKTSNVINPQKFEGHIQEQGEIAQTHNIDFTLAKKLLRRDYAIGYMDHHPIECVATGVRSPEHVRRVFREVTERKVQDTPIYYQDFAKTILEGNGDSLLRLERSIIYIVDMLAHAIVIAYETPGKYSKQRARAFLKKAVKHLVSLGEYTHLLPANTVVPDHFSVISEMALTLNEHQRSTLAQICIPNIHDRTKIEEAWSCEVNISREYIPAKHERQKNKFFVGRNINDFLFFGEITDLIKKSAPHEPRISGYEHRSTIAEKLNERPVSANEGITTHDLDTVHHTGPEYTYSTKDGYQTSTTSAYILELFCYPDTRGQFLPPTNFLPLISELLHDLHNPDVQRQCGKYEWEYLVNFLLWLHSSLVELSSKPYKTDVEKRDAVQSWMRTVIISIQQKQNLKEAARHCYVSIIGYHQNTGALQSMRMIGYSLVDARRTQSLEPSITIYGDERPLHLALKQAGDLYFEIMWRMNSILRFDSEKNRDGHSVSEQLIQISQKNDTCTCSRYVYIDRESVRQEWEMPAHHRKRIKTFVKKNHLAQ